MKKTIILIALLLTLGITTAAYAAGYPWSDHSAPYDYLFGNHIDTHQQSQLMGRNQLEGFFYIQYTGNEVNGVPEAMHANCGAQDADCTVGWKLKGVAVQATLAEHADHGGQPVWCIDPDDMPKAPGYTHFHWEGVPEHAGGVLGDVVYDGYLLKLTAVDEFAFKHHGHDGYLVTPGIDTVTHANVVTDCD